MAVSAELKLQTKDTYNFPKSSLWEVFRTVLEGLLQHTGNARKIPALSNSHWARLN